jgi:LmbE family N-acetylglucosaminyl deacetylase
LNILIIAAHPDDEVLGMGATIKKLAKKKNKIHLLVISEGATAQYSDSKMIKTRKDACKKSAKILGISSIDFLDYPDMKLDTISHLEINKEIERIVKKFKPKIVYTTPNHDLNLDHKIVHNSTLVATRPLSGVKEILSYEIPGVVKKPNRPNLFEDITIELDYKIKAMKCYKSELNQYPHPRSLKAIENLSIQRGIESGVKNAEAFQIIRSVRK